VKESGDGLGQMRKDSSPLAASFRCGTPVIFPQKNAREALTSLPKRF